MDHGPGNFMGNQGRWTAMPGGPLRKGTTAQSDHPLFQTVIANTMSFSFKSYKALFFLLQGPGMENQGGMRGAGPDWGNPRQHPIGAFPGQRNFQRG